MAIFDLAYSTRIGPRSEESKYVPCREIIAELAHCASRNSAKATGACACWAPGDWESGGDADDEYMLAVP